MRTPMTVNKDGRYMYTSFHRTKMKPETSQIQVPPSCADDVNGSCAVGSCNWGLTNTPNRPMCYQEIAIVHTLESNTMRSSSPVLPARLLYNTRLPASNQNQSQPLDSFTNYLRVNRGETPLVRIPQSMKNNTKLMKMWHFVGSFMLHVCHDLFSMFIPIAPCHGYANYFTLAKHWEIWFF